LAAHWRPINFVSLITNINTLIPRKVCL